MTDTPLTFTPPLLVDAGYAPARFPWKTVVLVALGLAFLGLAFQVNEGVRGLLALSFTGILFFLLRRDPAVGIAGTVGYLAMMGGLRRILIPAYGWSGTDPLLLVSGLTVICYFLFTRRNDVRTPLAQRLLLLMAIMALEIVNPFQGGLAIGLSGVLFYIVPLLWYFVGRHVVTPSMLPRIFTALIGIAVLGGIYGLYQTYFGLTPWEKEWVKITANVYVALNVGGVIRAFSFFTSGAEYSQFLGMGIVLAWTFWLRGKRMPMIFVPLLAIALFLLSARGPIVAVLATCTALWAIQGRTIASWVPRGTIAVALAIVGLVTGLTKVQSMNFGAATAGLVEHQTSGLLNPLDAKHSSATGHFNILVNGIYNGFRNPLGFGLGATTIAGQKFGGSAGLGTTEVDVSNMFESLGFIGGLLYLLIMFMIFKMAFAYWIEARTLGALGLLGILLYGLGAWLNGGHYAAGMLIWTLIGGLDRFQYLIALQKRKRL